MRVVVLAIAMLLAAAPPARADIEQGGFGGPDPCALELNPDRATTPSHACLRCHDGSRGGAFTAHRRGHPVDVVYRAGGWGQRSLRASPEQRAANLVLPEGRITCLTCHDPRSRAPFRLAAQMDGPVEARLCNACHTVGD